MSTIAAPSTQMGQGLLDQAERGDDVDGEQLGQRIERVVGEARQRRRAEAAGVVDEQVDAAAELDGGGDEVSAVVGIGDVARDGDDAVVEALDRRVQRGGVAAVGHDIPARLASARTRALPSPRDPPVTMAVRWCSTMTPRSSMLPIETVIAVFNSECFVTIECQLRGLPARDTRTARNARIGGRQASFSTNASSWRRLRHS